MRMFYPTTDQSASYFDEFFGKELYASSEDDPQSSQRTAKRAMGWHVQFSSSDFIGSSATHRSERVQGARVKK